MVGPTLRARVEGAPLPSLTAETPDWIVFGDAQTGKLDTANDYKAAALETVDTCERLQREAAAKITRPWWKFWG